MKRSLWFRYCAATAAIASALVSAGCGTPAATATAPKNGGASALTASANTVAFGNVPVGSTSSKQVTFTNSGQGNTNISVTQLAVSVQEFSFSGPALPWNLAPGQSATIVLAVTPKAAGTVSATLSVTSNASNSPMSLAISATAISASLTLNPSSLDFGNVSVGSTSTKSVSLSNNGSASATVSQATITGAAYKIQGLILPLTLAPGASASFTASFSPTALGSAAGSVSFASNASTSPTLPLAGAGVAAPVAQLTLSPQSVAFGNVIVGASGTQSMTIANTGNGSVTVSQITISGAGFSGSGAAVPLTLAPGQSTSYLVRYAPASPGSASGQISVVSSAANSPTQASLTGTGVAALAQLAASSSSVGFGNVTLGATGTRTVSVTSTGNVDVTISQITASGAGFSVIASATPLTLAPGQSATYTVKFSPSLAGVASGQISSVSNASSSPTPISLTGTGVAPPATLTASPVTLAFGSVLVGSTSTMTGSLTASGGSVTINSASITGKYSLNGLTLPATLTDQQSVSYNVVFAPTAAGSASSQANFASNAGNPSLSVSLTGSGGTLAHIVDLSWSPSTSTGIAGYKVYRALQTGGPYTLLTSSLLSGTAFSDGSVQSGKTYFYAVTAVDNSSAESAFSTESQAIIPLP